MSINDARAAIRIERQLDVALQQRRSAGAGKRDR
jgi:hypothetical protein